MGISSFLVTDRSRLLPLLGLAAVFTLLVAPVKNPVEDGWGAAAWNLVHLPAFALITHGFSRLAGGGRKGARHRFPAALLAMAVAVATELIQSRTGRSASWQDLVLDASGILLAVSWPCRPERWTLRRGTLAAVAALGGVAMALAPAATQAWAEHRMRAQLPNLADFRSRSGQRLWKAQGHAVAGVDRASGALQVRLAPGTFGGVNFLPGEQDWSGYSELVIHFANPGPRLLLGVRIDDNSSQTDRVWLSDQADVPAGRSEVRIDLRRAAADGPPRRINLARTRRLVLFVDKTERPVEFSILSAVLR